MAYATWKIDTLERFCSDVFTAFGFTDEESARISDVLLTADLYGIESHGMQRMVRYHKGIEKGQIHVGEKPEVVFETPVSAVIDGHSAMGQLTSIFAMEKAIGKAKAAGVGIVSVRESNHYGIAGYYAQMASEQGLIGFSCTNSEAIMVPTFGRKAMIGSNPIAVAVPADPYPFLFDSSTTVVTRGKLEMYNKMGKPLPQGWALDETGAPSDEAPRVLSNIVAKNGGGIMPLGGSSETLGSHKGYGWGMVAELFSSVLGKRDNAGDTARALAKAFADALTEKAAAAVTPSFKAFVKALADKGLKVVIATRSNLEALKPALEGLDPELVIPYQEISVTYGNCKWDAWARAVNTNGLVNVLTVGVTGSGNGVKSALVAGLSAIGVVHDHVAYQDFGGADAVVEKLDAKVADEVFRMLHL